MPWNTLKHFKKSEFAHPDEMDESFVFRLDAYRHYLECPLYLSATNETRNEDNCHVDKSWHYRGLAVDVIPLYMPLFKAYLAAERFGFTGIGLYPQWSYNGKITGGLHLDKRVTGGFRQSRWLRIKSIDGKSQDYALSWENLKKFGVIG